MHSGRKKKKEKESVKICFFFHKTNETQGRKWFLFGDRNEDNSFKRFIICGTDFFFFGFR